MLSLKYTCLFIAVASAFLDATPIPRPQSDDDFGLSSQILNSDDTFLNSPARTGRQNFFYDYPLSYFDNYRSPSYSDYYNSFYDPYYAPEPPRRPHTNSYPSKKRLQGNRRKGFPFEPTTQKYTIWDLARK